MKQAHPISQKQRKLPSANHSFIIVTLSIFALAFFYYAILSIGLTFSFYSLFLVLFLAFLFYCIYLLAKQTPLAKFMKVTVYILAVIALFAEFLYGYGLVKDLSGNMCTGLFGVRTSCANNSLFVIFILLFNKYTLIGLSLLCSAALVVQSRFNLNQRRSVTKD